MFTKKSVLAVGALAVSAALASPVMAAKSTMDVMQELDAQQDQIDEYHRQLVRQQAEVDRLRNRLRVEILDAPARFLAMDRNDDSMLDTTEVGKFASFASMDANNNGSVSVQEWKDRLPPMRMRVK
jgi:predicted  nucleic acid-binding Zn-ribbon protein